MVFSIAHYQQHLPVRLVSATTNREGNSTRKFSVGVFTQPRPTTEVDFSLDHLGEREKRQRDREAERRSLEVLMCSLRVGPWIPPLHKPKKCVSPHRVE